MSALRADHRQQRWIAWIPAAGAMILCAIQVACLVPNHDNTWLIELSVRMLNGGKYYTDFYELNPPLYPILLLPVDLLSRVTGIAPYTLFIVWVSALLYYVSVQLISCLPVIAPEIPFGSRVLLATCMQACLFLLPGYDFGQRDHVAICLIIPLLCHFINEQSGGLVARRAVTASVCAALGVLIKPFLAGVVLLLVAVRVLFTRRALDLIVPVLLPAAVVTACYILLVLTVFPEWVLMAHIAADAYSLYGIHQIVPVWTLTAFLLIAGLAAANECLQRPPAARRSVRYFAAAAAGALLSYVLQHKGFSYHLVPTKIMLGLIAASVGSAFLQRQERERSRLQPAFLMLLLLTDCGEEARSLHAPHKTLDFYTQLASTLTDLHAGHRLFFFSTSLPPQFPLNLYYPFTPSSRFPCLWTLPAALARGAAGGSGKEGGALTQLVAEDFRRWAPTAFLVDESAGKQALQGPFDYLPWFRQDPDMRYILDQYELAGHFPVAGPDRWALAIYVRRGPATSAASQADTGRN